MATESCWLLDLDGVVWLADQPIPGAAEGIARLRARGIRVAFFTNNSYARRAQHLAKFHRFGIDATDEDLLTSAEAAAGLCAAGERALVLGGPGVVEALEARGVSVVMAQDAADSTDVDSIGVDAVVVGIDPHLDYGRLDVAVRAIGRGARFLATNDDATFPTPGGPIPGGGAIVAAVAYASGVAPTIAGKPHAPAIELARQRLAGLDVVVGDRPSTDGALARGLGVGFALVLTGVTPAGHGLLEPEPDVEAPDLLGLVELQLDATPRAAR